MYFAQKRIKKSGNSVNNSRFLYNRPQKVRIVLVRHSKHLFLSIEKAERLNARQLRSYYGVIPVFYAEKVSRKEKDELRICFRVRFFHLWWSGDVCVRTPFALFTASFVPSMVSFSMSLPPRRFIFSANNLSGNGGTVKE